MIDLPYIELPLKFTKLLKIGIHNTQDDIDKIHRFVSACSSFSAIVKRSLSNFSVDDNLRSIISVLGWKRFRDRLASVYIKRQIDGAYPTISDLDYVTDILKFEEKYREFAVSGSSRVFMLGLYIKFVWVNSGVFENIYDGDSDLESNVYQLLKKRNNRSIQLDWVILILWHMLEHLDFNQIATTLESSKDPYFDLYKKLSSEAQDSMMCNMLAYGQSINEPELFTQTHV